MMHTLPIASRFVTVIAMVLSGASQAVAQSAEPCAPGTAEAYLDAGNVRAKILNTGALFYGGGPTAASRGYEVPRGSGTHAIFSASMWLGGYVDGELRARAAQYTGPFRPGPTAAEDCDQYDAFWTVRKSHFLPGAIDRSPVLRSWPVEAGAPFIDVNADGVYDPESGDRPELLGDQQVWWVMHDAPLGVDIQATAFAFDAPGALGNSTFYRYVIRNTTLKTIDRAYVGLWNDADLGYAGDDYMGSDTTLGLGYTYNADDDDEGFYGAAPPALGFTVLRRPVTSTSYQPECRYPDGRAVGFTNAIAFLGRGGANGDPTTARHFYNYMNSVWKDDAPLRQGGFGREVLGQPTRFSFSGNPVTGEFWSELNVDGTGAAHPPDDRRFVNGLGPFCLAPGEEAEVVFAIVWSRGSSNLDSVRQLKEDVAYIQSIRDVILTPKALSPVQQTSTDVSFAAGVYPNPAGPDGATVHVAVPRPLVMSVDVFDVLGRRVTTVVQNKGLTLGDHQWRLLTAGWMPGVYFVRIQAGTVVTTRRLVVGR